MSKGKVNASSGDVVALSYLGNRDFGGESTSPSPPKLTPQDEKKLWTKIDLRLLPILGLMYLMAFMDRVNIANAKLEGLDKQLGLKGNEFNLALTMFFIPYCLLELPSNLVLKKFRPSRWLPIITTIWGLVTVSMGFVRNYPELLGARLALGAAEAGLFPGMAYYATFWYPRHLLQTRVSMLIASASLSGAFSGLLAYAIGFMSGTGGRLGWSWIFILEGSATVLVGVCGFFLIVDDPATAWFLTPEEREFVAYQKRLDCAKIAEEEQLETRHFRAIATDWQIYVHIIIFMTVATPAYSVVLFIPSIINEFGYSVPLTQLLTIPPFLLGTIVVITSSIASDRLRIRSPFILGGLLCYFVGFIINILSVSIHIKYFGLFLLATGIYTSIPGVVAWVAGNFSGQYKRGMAIAIQTGIGSFSATFAANFYRSQDAPRYIFGHSLSLMFVGLGFITVSATVFTYNTINRRREKMLEELLQRGEKLDPVEIQRLGDKAPTYRYML